MPDDVPTPNAGYELVQKIAEAERDRLAALPDDEYVREARKRTELMETISSRGILPIPPLVAKMVDRIKATSDEELLRKRAEGVPLMTPEELGIEHTTTEGNA